ncbi:MAG: OmpA family protein [Myxococcota bacterium]
MSDRSQTPLAELKDLVSPGSERLADALPEAVTLRSARDDKLGRALASTVERALEESVQRSPETIADAIFPVIGPAIRKSIRDALRAMTQSLNQTMEQTLSVQGLRWRLEAMQTGRPVAEVILRHTLLYRVEHVFLIHRDSGILLASLSEDPQVRDNADMISGMLTAIRSFASDSFGTPESTSLDAIELGELEIHIQQGPYALLAVVFRGTPPRELLGLLGEVLEEVHESYSTLLRGFDGDTELFQPVVELLQRCVVWQEKPRGQRVSPILVGAGLALVVLGILGLLSTVRSSQELGRLRGVFRNEPGFVVLAAERRGDGFYLEGLRDPLSRDPTDLLSSSQIDPEHVDFDWRPFVSLEPTLAERRARQSLRPPKGVELSLEDRVLWVRGEAEALWIQRVVRSAPFIAGVSRVDLSGVVAAESAAIRNDISSLERLRIAFEPGASRITDNDAMDAAGSALNTLESSLRALGCTASVVVAGYTDSTGSLEANAELSRLRAVSVRRALLDEYGVSMSLTPVSGRVSESNTASTSSRRVVSLTIKLDGECWAL